MTDKSLFDRVHAAALAELCGYAGVVEASLREGSPIFKHAIRIASAASVKPVEPGHPTDAETIVRAIDRMGDKIVAYYMRNLDLMERMYARQLSGGPTLELAEQDEHSITYHVGGIVRDEGENAGVLAVTANTDPSPNFPESVRIVIGAPKRSPLMAGRIPKIDTFAMSVETAEQWVATVQQAIRDVRAAKTIQPPKGGHHADPQDR